MLVFRIRTFTFYALAKWSKKSSGKGRSSIYFFQVFFVPFVSVKTPNIRETHGTAWKSICYSFPDQNHVWPEYAVITELILYFSIIMLKLETMTLI